MNNSLEFATNQLYRAEHRESGVAIISNYNNKIVHFVDHDPTYVNAAGPAMDDARRWIRRQVEPVYRSINGYPNRDHDLNV